MENNNNTTTKQQTTHKTGYYVWVGAEKRWFRSEDRARAFFQARCSQYGVASVQLQAVEAGSAITGWK